MEEFRIINGFENYSVSNFGNVKNNTKNKLLKLSNSDGYKVCRLNGKFLRVHRLVGLGFVPNPDNKPCIDHIDNNRENNNVENLRWATSSENRYNSSIQSNNKSGYKGINWSKRENRWRTTICENGKRLHLGYFKTLEKAINARREKANELFGEFTNQCEKQEINIKVEVPKDRKIKKVKVEVEFDDDNKDDE